MLLAWCVGCVAVFQPAGSGAGPSAPMVSAVVGADGVPGDLAAYVARDDGAFSWKHESTFQGDGVTVYHLRMTSQKWRTEAEVDHPLWTHWVSVAVPDRVEHSTGILLIGGGRRRAEPVAVPPAEMLMIVRGSGAVVVHVDNVPNQPLVFAGETRERFEDGLLAHTWNLAMASGEAEWIGRFPMVKSAVRAMDAAEAFLKEGPEGGFTGPAERAGAGPRVDGWFVTGASKRGWTAWLTAAVDGRVKAIAPIVIDVLNLPAQTPHHFASYGFWAPALKDYEEAGVARKFGTPELNAVIRHEDPLSYMPRLTMPKYIVTAGGDEFFPADSARHYVDAVSPEWRMRTVPNAGHNLRGSAAPLEVLGFYKAFVRGVPRPEVAWTHRVETRDGVEADVLEVRVGAEPVMVQAWRVDNPKARDFRIGETGRTWTAERLSAVDEGGRVFVARVPRPAEGWRAYFVECVFAGGKATDPAMVFTTRVYVTPDTLPFAGVKPE